MKKGFGLSGISPIRPIKTVIDGIDPAGRTPKNDGSTNAGGVEHAIVQQDSLTVEKTPDGAVLSHNTVRSSESAVSHIQVRTRQLRGAEKPSSSGESQCAPRPKKEWTLFVYMSSENNLEASGAADLEEMQKHFADVAPFMNVVVLCDSSQVQTELFILEQDDNGRSVARELHVPANTALGELMGRRDGDLNMASGETLQAALDFVRQQVPSQKFFLDVWGHGFSFKGVAPDDSAPVNQRELQLREIARVLDNAKYSIDVFGFDACLMQNLSVASTLSSHATYMIGSEQSCANDGWPYAAVFKKLALIHQRDGDLAAAEVAKTVVRTSGAETTSSLRLEGIPALKAAINRLGRALVDAGGFGNAAIAKACDEEPIRFDDPDLADLGSVCAALCRAFPANTDIHRAATAVHNKLDKAITLHHAGEGYEGTSGLTIFLPYSGGLSRTFMEQNGWIEECPSWQQFLRTGEYWYPYGRA